MSLESPKAKEEKISSFIFPNLKTEQDEIVRTAIQFAKEDTTVFLKKFIERAKESEMIVMTEDIWSKLENTDSYDIKKGDWKMVEYHAVEGNPTAPRDWQTLKLRIEKGEQLNAPIICQKGGTLHLVSGNTRLMVSRALEITPSVLWVNMD